MTSTLKRDLKQVDGVMTFPMKEYPDWYGIPDIGFIWYNTQTDPMLEYKGKLINSTIIEDTMWERYTHDDDGNYISINASDEEGFKHFMLHNKDDVYELLETAMEA